jgi:uncharacterized repeat protein (TIGR03847 family)
VPEIEFDPVDAIAAGAVGVPGRRAFYIQATKDGQVLSVLVEKEQVAVLADRIQVLLDQVASQFPGEVMGHPAGAGTGPGIIGDPVPLFRAVAIGIGFDPGRRLVVLELHERPLRDEDDDGDDDDDEEPPPELPGEDEPEGYLARLYATPDQIRAMATGGQAAVAAGRPPCPLCGNPLDPEDHVCPKLNGHARRP